MGALKFTSVVVLTTLLAACGSSDSSGVFVASSPTVSPPQLPTTRRLRRNDGDRTRSLRGRNVNRGAAAAEPGVRRAGGIPRCVGAAQSPANGHVYELCAVRRYRAFRFASIIVCSANGTRRDEYRCRIRMLRSQLRCGYIWGASVLVHTATGIRNSFCCL